MHSSDPRPETGSLMQLESRRAVSQAGFTALIIQSLSQDILIIPQLDGREVKNHCRLRDHGHFFHFLVFRCKPGSCQLICGIIIANKNFSSAKAALVCSFRDSWKNRRHLRCGNVMRSRLGRGLQRVDVSSHDRENPQESEVPPDNFFHYQMRDMTSSVT